MPGQLLQRGELPQRTGFSARGCVLAEASRRDGGSLRQATTFLQ
ncbi:MAG: hypothetical protein V7K46_14945 [Nostoc sp.]